MAREIAEEYASSLADLTVNSKPLINMLTILAEENVDHAGVIVETVEKHLEKVQPEIKLPVLYLVDSIIKNVGGAYTTKFSQNIVSMFTKTFKVVDEKTRSQMFKLRETWHEVFPSTKLYQLDVKVNVLDHAWPIQAQPQITQSNIHFNPNFLKKPAAAAAGTVVSVNHDEEEAMRRALAKKEHELLMLQQKKIEMQLEQTKRQLELAEKNAHKAMPQLQAVNAGISASVKTPLVDDEPASEAPIPVKQRLGPPVNRSGSTTNPRIAPVSSALLASARRDPRLARLQSATQPDAIPQAQQHISPNVFDIKPLERPAKITKRKNAITIDVRTENVMDINENGPHISHRRDPRLEKHSRNKDSDIRNHRDFVKKRHSELREKKVKNEKLLKRSDEISIKKKDIEKVIIPKRSILPIDIRKSDEKSVEPVNDTIMANNDKGASDKQQEEEVLTKFLVVDSKKINKLPPIPKLNKSEDCKSPVKKVEEGAPSPSKKRKDSLLRSDKRSNKKRDSSGKDSSDSSSPDKKVRLVKESDHSSKSKIKEQPMEVDIQEKNEDEVVPFKELKNYHKDRYMRRNKEKSPSPDKPNKEAVEEDKEVAKSSGASNTDITIAPEIAETKDVDLRILAPASNIAPAAPVTHKRPSTENIEPKTTKKHKFDILFGNEDVDLRQLPQVDEINAVPQVPSEDVNVIKNSPKTVASPFQSPQQKDWTDIKETIKSPEDQKNARSQLDRVRAKLAVAIKGKDGSKSNNSGDNSKRRSISSDDSEAKTKDLDPENDKESIKIIISQAEEQYKEGNINKEQYNTLMFQVMKLNEKMKLKEAKQRESFEESKRKLSKTNVGDEEIDDACKPNNTFGDIDERIMPTTFIPREPVPSLPLPQDVGIPGAQDSDLRLNNVQHNPEFAPPPPLLMMPTNMSHLPRPPMFAGPLFPPVWRGPSPHLENFNGPRSRLRGPMPPRFDKRVNNRFEPPMPMLPPPIFGKYQGPSPLEPYTTCESPPLLGTPGVRLPDVDYRLIEFIEQDPMKTIEIDGVPREIRFYGETAIIMLDWDDPREIKFLPGSRRITFDNKDSIVLAFNEDYRTIEVDDQTFNIRFGAPTRELYINDKWYECFFNGPPMPIMVDSLIRLIQLEGPAPQVDIGREKRLDLVAGKINLIIDAEHMFPIFLDAKVQMCRILNTTLTIRFVDSLKTVLINEVPFKVEFGGLPRPIFIGTRKHFIRFSVLPRNLKPGHVVIANMEGSTFTKPPTPPLATAEVNKESSPMDIDASQELPLKRFERTLSPEAENSNPGLDMLASVMPSSMAPASQFSGYSLASTMTNNKIPGLDTPMDENPPPEVPGFPLLNNINVNDLFAKLVATGIVPTPQPEITKPVDEKKSVEEKEKKDKNIIKPVDLLKSETLRVKQPAIVSKLYGGMQCSGCGTRFPPEHTVRYSQHLDWHFRQNRRERDSARRAHSRHWHYDLADWVQYEEIEDLEEREKNWFETAGQEGDSEAPTEVPEAELPSVPAGSPQEQHCALCGDKFDQFYNEDKEEWHLRKAVRHNEQNYHPLCFEDLKVSEAKEEAMELNESAAEEPSVIIVEKDETSIEAITVLDEDDGVQSDNDDVVEVLDNDSKKEETEEPLEIDEGDEDDVVLKVDPLIEVEVDDDADTDDETQAERAERDRQAEIDFSKIKIKQEPVDPDDEPIITAEEEAIRPIADNTSTTVLSTIDGNIQFDSRLIQPAVPSAGIRINISTVPVARPVPVEEPPPQEEDDEPLPPGEELEMEYTLKPALQNVVLHRQPPVQKGIELSGLCSIM